MTKRVLICGNPDLNYIDGSSIWAQTIALAISKSRKAKVDFIAKSTPDRDELFGPLKSDPNIEIVDGTDTKYWGGKASRRLSQPMMAELLVKLDSKKPYDAIVVRGLEIAAQLLKAPKILERCWLYLTDIPQDISKYSSAQRNEMKQLGEGCQKLLCQTTGFVELWKELVPSLSDDKFKLYSPVIPDLKKDLKSIAERPRTAVYAGKFKGDWMTLEMANLWPEIHAKLSSSNLVVIGDKIHNEVENPNYVRDMESALVSTKGLNWLGAQPREVVQHHLQNARVGLSWRHERMNETIEYSTKILEYGGAGCAAILNRNALHEQLLGVDYPLFANNEKEFLEKLKLALSDSELTQMASDSLRQIAERHTLSERSKEISNWLDETPTPPEAKKVVKVLLAGHDLKFFTLLQKKLEASGQFQFVIDQWQGHSKHDEVKSKSLLKEVDVIFCEWCLGNIRWYSKNKLPNQRLVARFHAQESRTPYLAESNWDNIDHISFVSEHTRKEALDIFKGFPLSKTSVIPNYLDTEKFTPKRKTGEARFTLGMVGVAPMSKRLDRAIDLLEVLLESDERYCLRIKGKHPLDYVWLLNREDELLYYRNIFERINSKPSLRYKVIFDPPGDDVNDWFTMVGFILSPSDHESYHMAIGEGLLTGSIPIIWDWKGASSVWPNQKVVKNTSEAKKFLRNFEVTKLTQNRTLNFETNEVLEKVASLLLKGTES